MAVRRQPSGVVGRPRTRAALTYAPPVFRKGEGLLGEEVERVLAMLTLCSGLALLETRSAADALTVEERREARAELERDLALYVSTEAERLKGAECHESKSVRGDDERIRGRADARAMRGASTRRNAVPRKRLSRG